MIKEIEKHGPFPPIRLILHEFTKIEILAYLEILVRPKIEILAYLEILVRPIKRQIDSSLCNCI